MTARGTYVISDGDEPSIRMVRVVQRVYADAEGVRVIAPYLRRDQHGKHGLRRFDRMPTTLSSLTPVAHFGRRISISHAAFAIDVPDDHQPIAAYHDGQPRKWVERDEDIAIFKSVYEWIIRDAPPAPEPTGERASPAPTGARPAREVKP